MKIDRIEVFVTSFPQRIKREMASGTWDTGPAERILGKPIFVKVFADGIVGYAQIRPIAPNHIVADSTSSVFSAIAELYAPKLIGKDLCDLENNVVSFDRILAGNPTARSVLDHAIHDAIGKAFKVPVYKLLGGLCQQRIPLEWSIGMADDPKKIAEEALRALNDFGIRVQCVKAGDRRGWQQDVKNFAAVREAVGPDVMLGVDPNEAWTVDVTIAALRAMEPYHVGYLEQPTARRDIEGLAEIRRQANGVPLLADESLFTIDDALDLAKHRAVDGFCIKLYKVGGLRPAKKIAAIAEAGKIRLNVGGVCAFSQLEAAATAHFYASIPEHRMVGAAEFVFGLGTFGPDPLVPDTDFVIKEGHATVPDRPGLGIEIDEQALKKLTLRHEVIA